MKRVLSGIQPSGSLHIGNYFGMMSRMIKYQDENDARQSFCKLLLNSLYGKFGQKDRGRRIEEPKLIKELMQDGEWRTIQDILDALDLDSSYRNRIKGKLGKLRQGGYPKYNKRKIEVERKNRVGNRTKTIYEYKISLNE